MELRSISLTILFLFYLYPFALTDFVFPDFNQTTGIEFVGDSATTSCADIPEVLCFWINKMSFISLNHCYSWIMGKFILKAIYSQKVSGQNGFNKLVPFIHISIFHC